MVNKGFIQWLREVINPQATYGYNVSVGDFCKDGMTEYLYPKEFIVNGDKYSWTYGLNHTKGRHLCTHYELWFHGPAVGHRKIATGPLNKAMLRKGLQIIYEYYKSKEL